MKEFLFGWLIKPEILQTPLDSIVCVIEVLIFMFVIIPVGLYIMATIKEFFEKRKQK